MFNQDKIVLPDDLEFHDIYDTRSYYYSSTKYLAGTSVYQLKNFFFDNISLVKSVKDVYYSENVLPVYEIERQAQRLSRDNYSIVGTWGTEDLNITFSYPLPTNYTFYVKYTLEEYSLPLNFTLGISTIKNELAVIFERYSNTTNRDIFLDVSDESFQFQDDIFISNGVNDNNISRQADVKYDNNNLVNIIYSSEVNNTFSQLVLKHTIYNASSGQFDEDQIITDPIDFGDYDYYKMLNPLVNFAFNDTLLIAYETNFKKTGESDKWKIQYMYFDPITDNSLGPFFIKSSESTQERNPDSYWSNGVFWTFSVNDSDSWSVEYTSSHRADLNSFSAISADFLPRIYNRDMFNANMSIYFNLDLGSFTNDLLESEDRIRFIVSLEDIDSQYILLDTDWNVQELESWVESNLATYYPRYLRYYYDLSLGSLTFSEINNTDTRVQNKIYPFELNFPYPINFTEHFTLNFNVVKDDWSLNSSADFDRYQLGIDNVDISFEMIPVNSTANTFGILTKSDSSSSYALSEFLISNRISLNTLSFLSDPNLYQSDSNLIDLIVDFDATSLLYDPISQMYIPPASDLECQLMVMVENDAVPDLTVTDEIVYDSWTGYQLKDLHLETYWTKDFGSLYYSLNLDDYTIDIYNKDEYFELTTSDKQQLFSILQAINTEYDEVYLVLQFKVKTFDLNQYNSQNGINLIFNDLGLIANWANGSGIQEQKIFFLNETLSEFEKLSKEAYLTLISDNDLTINDRDDLIVLSSFSNGFFPSGSDGNYRYYLPVNQKEIEDMSPTKYLNLVNLHINDCKGYNDAFSGLLVDGPELTGEVGLVSPNLYSNETCDYQLRAIIELYPFFNYQNGSGLDKTFAEFKDELLRLKLEVYNEYNAKILSEYSDTTIKMGDFDLADFNSSVNSLGEKYYYMDTPLKLYIYGEDILTNTEYIFFKLIAEFSDTFYLTTEKTFRNQWGVFIDSANLEFIQDDILPSFSNLEPFDILTGTVDIDVKAVGNDYEWAALYYNYKNMGSYSGYDLIANITQFSSQNDYSSCTFNWNTSELTDDSIYKVMVEFQNKKGFKGNVSVANITVINTSPNITSQAYSLDSEGWSPISDLEEVANTLKLTTVNNDDLPLTKVIYYLYDELPSTQNKDSWTKLIEVVDVGQNFDYFISVDDIPNGTWYIISEAFNGGPSSTWEQFMNRTVVDTFSNALTVTDDDKVSKQYDVSLLLSSTLENRVNFAKFWAQKQGESNWTLINNATFSPFSAPFINLPWSETTTFKLRVEVQITYNLFGIKTFNVTRNDIILDLDGPTISVENNPDDVLYQIQQAEGSWIATSSFDGIINGSLTSSDPDFETYQVSYDYGKGWRDDAKLYDANDLLQWNIRYMPDGDVNFRITGLDTYKNPSNILEFSFINDQNFFNDLYIENYAFDQIYDVFKPFKFKIIPITQDLKILNLTVSNTVYTFTKVDPPTESMYFEKEIEFNIGDFDFEDQTVDTQLITIQTSDLKSHSIELTIPFTMSLGLDTEVIVNDLRIEKNHYNLNGINESTWWKFDEGNGIIIYDSSGNKDGTLVGAENWATGKIGNSALNLETITYIPSQSQDFEVLNGSSNFVGDLFDIDNNFTQFNSTDRVLKYLTPTSQDFNVITGNLTYGNLELEDNINTTIEAGNGFVQQSGLKQDPSRWSAFTLSPYGSENTVGELLIDGGTNCIVDAGSYQSWGSESYLGYIKPDQEEDDIYSNWNEGDAAQHAPKLDEAKGDMNGDGGNIRETSVGVDDRWHFTSLTLPTNHRVTKMVFYALIKKEEVDTSTIVDIDTSISTSSGYWWATAYGAQAHTWRSYTKTGLNMDQTALNGFWLNVQPSDDPVPQNLGGNDIAAVYVEVYTTPLNTYYKHDWYMTWNVPDPDLYSIDTLVYDYRTTSASHTDFVIYNWDTPGWETSTPINDATSTSWQTGSYTLTDPYISSSDQVRVRFISANSYSTNFDIEMDKMYLNYTESTPNYEIEAKAEWSVSDSDLSSIDYLNFSHFASPSINFYIWKYTGSGAPGWEHITTSNPFAITSDYFNSSNTFKIRYFKSDSSNFTLNIDKLRVDYTGKSHLNFSSTIPMGSTIMPLDLFYSLRTNISQLINISVWNFDNNEWEGINSDLFISFNTHRFSLNSSYIDNNEVIVNFYGVNSSSLFTLDLEMLKVVAPNYVETPIIFNNDQDPLTFMGWVKLDELNNSPTLYGEFTNNGFTRNHIYILPDGALGYDQHTPTDGSSVSDPALVDIGQWTHIAIVKINNSITFYKNGLQYGDSVPHYETYSGASPTTAGIGAKYFGNNWCNNNLNGSINDFRFYTSELSKGMIQLIYNNSYGTNQSLQTENYDGIYSPL
ncbi:MAG: LamG domain-containing protein [Candidatus Kariarchaeaceae archaeon]